MTDCNTDEAADRIEVQMHPDGISIDLPEDVVAIMREDTPYRVSLSYDEADTLRDLLNEAWLNRWGLQPLSITWREVEVNDVIPGLGKRCAGSPFKTDTDDTYGKVYFIGGGSMTLSFQTEVTVHRRIT